jgi:hypothetical protein
MTKHDFPSHWPESLLKNLEPHHRWMLYAEWGFDLDAILYNWKVKHTGLISALKPLLENIEAEPDDPDAEAIYGVRNALLSSMVDFKDVINALEVIWKHFVPEEPTAPGEHEMPENVVKFPTAQ